MHFESCYVYSHVFEMFVTCFFFILFAVLHSTTYGQQQISTCQQKGKSKCLDKKTCTQGKWV